MGVVPGTVTRPVLSLLKGKWLGVFCLLVGTQGAGQYTSLEGRIVDRRNVRNRRDGKFSIDKLEKLFHAGQPNFFHTYRPSCSYYDLYTYLDFTDFSSCQQKLTVNDTFVWTDTSFDDINNDAARDDQACRYTCMAPASNKNGYATCICQHVTPWTEQELDENGVAVTDVDGNNVFTEAPLYCYWQLYQEDISIDVSQTNTLCPDCQGDADNSGCTDAEAQQCKIRTELFKHTQCGKEVFTKAVVEPMDLMEQEIRFGVVQNTEDYCVKEYFECPDGNGGTLGKCNPLTGCPEVPLSCDASLTSTGYTGYGGSAGTGTAFTSTPQTYTPCIPKFADCLDPSTGAFSHECGIDAATKLADDSVVCVDANGADLACTGFKCADDSDYDANAGTGTCNPVTGTGTGTACTTGEICFDGTECEFETNPDYRKTTWDIIGEQCENDIKTFKEGTFDVFIRRERDIASGPALDERENCFGGNGEPDRDANGVIEREHDPGKFNRFTDLNEPDENTPRVGPGWVARHEASRITGDEINEARCIEVNRTVFEKIGDDRTRVEDAVMDYVEGKYEPFEVTTNSAADNYETNYKNNFFANLDSMLRPTDAELALDTKMREEIATTISGLGTNLTEFLLGERSALLQYGADNVTEAVNEIQIEIDNMEEELKKNQSEAINTTREEALDRVGEYITNAFKTFAEEFEDYVDARNASKRLRFSAKLLSEGTLSSDLQIQVNTGLAQVSTLVNTTLESWLYRQNRLTYEKFEDLQSKICHELSVCKQKFLDDKSRDHDFALQSSESYARSTSGQMYIKSISDIYTTSGNNVRKAAERKNELLRQITELERESQGALNAVSLDFNQMLQNAKVTLETYIGEKSSYLNNAISTLRHLLDIKSAEQQRHLDGEIRSTQSIIKNQIQQILQTIGEQFPDLVIRASFFDNIHNMMF